MGAAIDFGYCQGITIVKQFVFFDTNDGIKSYIHTMCESMNQLKVAIDLHYRFGDFESGPCLKKLGQKKN